ncbi:MAG: prolyl oligopeptidase family serine peptidase, partial [Luminiphilus sp.]|nr:prolyl oligopeptidase family serine peptidase [Luminiphilus sp.]
MTGHHLKLILMATLVGVLVAACESEDQTKEDHMQSLSKSTPLVPPITRVENVVDTHWGVQVKDPYRWLENQESQEVLHWFEQQGGFTEQVLSALPIRGKLLERLIELDQGAPYSTYGVRQLKNGDLFFLRRNAGESLAKLYHQPKDSGEAKLLLDPDTLANADDSHASIEGYMPSWEGRFLVYGVAQGGSEETTYGVIDLTSGATLPDTLTNIETAYNRPQWSLDGQGFYYSRRRELPVDAPDTEIYKRTEVRYHAIGADPTADVVVAAFGVSDRLALLETDFPSIVITPGSDYAVLKVKHGDNNEISIFSAPLETIRSGTVPWVRITQESDLVTDFAVVDDSIFLITAKDAPRFKLVKTSLAAPSFASAEEVIAAGDLVLESIAAAADAIYLSAKQDGVNKVQRLSTEGDVTALETPRDGAAYISSVSPQVPGVLVYESTWIQGGVRYAYDPVDNNFSDTGMVPQGKFDDLDGYISEEVLVTSHDGVKVPVSILRRADLVLDGTNPTIVYGYGSYGISQDVSFSPIRLGWIEQGGIFAIAHVRGGGEYGQAWHYAGRMQNKPNTWKDLIATAEYLIDKGYTAANHMAPMGGSAGGILAGRSITERPDLFGAVVMQVGMLDAIRAETTTNGVPNIKEFGSVTDAKGFEGLLAMSAYHHVEDGVQYPAALLTHGFNDPRVNPWMSGKMAARLQAVAQNNTPALLRVDFDAGHGIGSTREQVLAQYADIYSFL